MRSRLAWLQLALACVFAAVCARTDPDEVAVPAIFGSFGAVVVFSNLFGLVLTILYAVGLSRADLSVEDRSPRQTGILDAALGLALSGIMVLGLFGRPANAQVIRDVPILLAMTMIAARWMPRNVSALPAIAYFFVGLLAGRQRNEREGWWNWPVADAAGPVSVGWIIATTVCGVLALSLPVRTVRRRCEADLG
ncbi:hypothetical protein PA25G_06667 [Cutibacterium acnes 25G]|nr:hypothetical protein [Cutibacterium acnes 25G]